MTESNPYAADDATATIGDETQTELEHAVARLAAIGATSDEVDAFVARWDDFDDQWTPEIRTAWLSCTDADLRAELRAIRVEYAIGTVTQEDHDAAVVAAEHARLVEEAQVKIGTSVPGVLAWVDGDPGRAAAAAIVERAQPSPRGTLLDALARIAPEAAAPVVDDQPGVDDQVLPLEEGDDE